MQGLHKFEIHEKKCHYIIKEFKKKQNHHLVPPQQVNLIQAFMRTDEVTKIQVSGMYDLGIIRSNFIPKMHMILEAMIILVV